MAIGSRGRRTKGVVLFALHLTVLGACAGRVHGAGATVARCWQPVGLTENSLAYVRERVTGTAPRDAAFRARIHLPAVAASEVQLVTDESVCADAIAEHVASRPAEPGVEIVSLLVIRVGEDRYVVTDGILGPSGNWQYHVLDARYGRLASFT